MIILITDGVNNVGNMTPMQAAEEAKKANIKVYTIGVGTDESARLPIGRSRRGTKYQSIPGGSIDMVTLEKISNLTGGNVYLTKDDDALKDVLEEINQLEKTEIKSNGQIIYKEYYFEFIFLGVILLILSGLFRKFYIREVL